MKEDKKQATRESSEMTWRETQGYTKDVGGSSSQALKIRDKAWIAEFYH